MFAEYGARVMIEGMVDFPDNTHGTIVHIASDVVLVKLDDYPTPFEFVIDEIRVTQTPSESAYLLTQRYSVDEVLVQYIEVIEAAGVGADGGIYGSALVFELYRLNYHAETLLADTVAQYAGCVIVLEERHDGGWESGACDDGYGYPVYRVED